MLPSPDPSATIRYTTNGVDPTRALSTVESSLSLDRLDVITRAVRDGTMAEQVFSAFLGKVPREDYITYAALQLGKDKEARAVVDEVRRIEKVDTEHFAAAFAFTATEGGLLLTSVPVW